MKFISPFQFVAFDRLKSNYSKELDEAKANLLAQFGNSESIKINVKGQMMSKNDVTELFASFDNGNYLRYYSEIQKDTVLTSFLQQAKYNANEYFRPAGVFHDKVFVDFISPYFSNSYVSVFKQYFEEKNNVVVKSLMNINAVLLNEHWRIKSKNLIEEVLNLQAEKLSVAIIDIENDVTYSHRKLLDLHHPDLIFCYNALPSNYEAIRIAYAQKMIELATAINTQDKEQAQFILSDAKLMDTTPNMELKIEKAKNKLNDSAAWYKNMNPAIYGIIGFIFFLMAISYFNHRRTPTESSTVYQDVAPQEEKFTRTNQSANESLAENTKSNLEILKNKVANKAQKAKIVRIKENLQLNKTAFNDFVKAQKLNGNNIVDEKAFFDQQIVNYQYQFNVNAVVFAKVRKEYVDFLQDCYVRYNHEVNFKNNMHYFFQFLSDEKKMLYILENCNNNVKVAEEEPSREEVPPKY